MLQGRELAHKTRGGTWNMWPNLLITGIPSSPHLLCALTGRMYQQIQSHKDPLCPSILNFTNYKWVSMIVWSVCFILYINNTSQIFFLQVWGDQLQWLITFQKSVKEIHKFINVYRCFPELGFSTLFKTLKFFIILVNFLYDAWLRVFCVFLLIWISGNLNFCVCITLLPAVFMQVKHSFKF